MGSLQSQSSLRARSRREGPRILLLERTPIPGVVATPLRADRRGVGSTGDAWRAWVVHHVVDPLRVQAITFRSVAAPFVHFVPSAAFNS